MSAALQGSAPPGVSPRLCVCSGPLVSRPPVSGGVLPFPSSQRWLGLCEPGRNSSLASLLSVSEGLSLLQCFLLSSRLGLVILPFAPLTLHLSIVPFRLAVPAVLAVGCDLSSFRCRVRYRPSLTAFCVCRHCRLGPPAAAPSAHTLVPPGRPAVHGAAALAASLLCAWGRHTLSGLWVKCSNTARLLEVHLSDSYLKLKPKRKQPKTKQNATNIVASSETCTFLV